MSKTLGYSELVDSSLRKTASDVERKFWCERCEHRWLVPEWFPHLWVARPENPADMMFEEFNAYLQNKIFGGLGVPARYITGEREPKPIPEFTDEELLTPKAWVYTHRSPELEKRVLRAMYEASEPYMPKE